MFHRILLIIAVFFPFTVMAAAGIEPVESIRAAVLTAITSSGEVEVTLDPALRMPRCADALQAKRSSHGTVEVSCPAPSRWRLFVPIRVRQHHPVLVLTRAIAAGETIRADMLGQDTRDTGRIVGSPLSDPVHAIGQVARRALAAGSVLTAAHLRAPEVIRRNDQVTLVSRQGGIEVRMPARALSAAGIGERIQVENLSSRRRVQGSVLAGGEVQVLD